MTNDQVIIVTGSNRGVGKGIISLLAQQSLSSPLTIYATSRCGSKSDIQPSNSNRIIYTQLDITNISSIASLFSQIRENNHTAFILINNAAVSNDYRETPKYAAETVMTNYHGTRDMCVAFLSQANLKPGSRIVNVTSGYNALSTYAPSIQAAFRSAATISDVDGQAQSYLSAVTSGPEAQEGAGWGAGARSYKVSKALVNVLTVVLARQNPGVLVNCCCPGWTDTDMGRQGKGVPPKTVEEGARTAVRCAVGVLGVYGDDDGGLGRGMDGEKREGERISGMFFENDSIVSTGWGKAKVWLDT
ncbi:NAD(P)-binding protein [Plenodomus tracheiphilus IPT5]|uniref:NAD(P)-binding protein n=1 Tax=Plenodomus tracheiphilus IPT5 TaxID=1408161 RepID=A0A6A7ANM2_9PLEO|nr:NAD(P)-binding protein [Plenodomus tracheiphilus IPT5]